MSQNPLAVPEAVERLAMKIITRFHLDRDATLSYVGTVIREAVYEERKSAYLREPVSCFGCRLTIFRHQGVNEGTVTRCPLCREPMLTQEELFRKKYHLLEEHVRQSGPESGGRAGRR
jgi:hypothetical protein